MRTEGLLVICLRRWLRGSLFLLFFGAALASFAVPLLHGGEPGDESAGAAAGLVRVPNTTLRLPSEPAGFRYATEIAYFIGFDQPVAIASVPGETNRLFVAGKRGFVYSLTNLAAPARRVFLDISPRVFSEWECGLLGLAFHPRFAENGYFYILYTSGAPPEIRIRLSRFQVSPADPATALSESEEILYTMTDPDPWHQGGSLQFGPDGYLYVSTGDGGFVGAQPQFLDRNLFSGILRLDVDKKPGSLAPAPHPGVAGHYAIPPDNPFVGALSFNGVPIDVSRIRTEFYAVGLRNPWKFSFDSLTGDLYSNDTGSNYREEVNLILAGGNYGWPFTEGSLTHTNSVNGGRKQATLIWPIAEYGYPGGGAGVGKAIAGGLLYRGTNYPSLNGGYLFSDFETGDIGLIYPDRSQSVAAARSAQAEIASLRRTLRDLLPYLETSQLAWEEEWRDSDQQWTVIRPRSASTTSKNPLNAQRDGSLMAGGPVAWRDIYTAVSWLDQTNITALRIEFLTSPSLAGGGPGRSAGGNFVLSEVQVNAAPASNVNDASPVRLKRATANYSQMGWSADQLIDGVLTNGWAIGPAGGQPHQLVVEFERPVSFAGGTVLAVILPQVSVDGGTIGRFRLSVTTAATPPPVDPYPLVAEIIRTEPGLRAADQEEKLRLYYRSVNAVTSSMRERIAELRLSQAEESQGERLPINWIGREPGASAFGLDPRTGDILLSDMINGAVRKLREVEEVGEGFPADLKDTGVFADLASLTPAPGVVPYWINTPFWSDHAEKRRWFSIPDVTRKMQFSRDGNWQFPPGSVWIKHFDLELTNGVPESARRMETRVLVRSSFGVHGATYRWSANGLSASLVEDKGLDEPVLIHDGGLVRTQVWSYPSRSQCLQCHTPAAGYALGFNTAQLQRDVSYGGAPENQIEALTRAGYLLKQPAEYHTLPALAAAANPLASREFRVRSFLQANCAQCHQPGGITQSAWDARIITPLAQAGIVNALPVHGGASAADRIVAPGSPENSVMLRRLANLGKDHMPPLATSVINEEAVELLRDWIEQDLASYETFEAWQARSFPGGGAGSAALADPDQDGTSNYGEYLLKTDPLAVTEGLELSIERSSEGISLHFPRFPNLVSQVEWTDNPANSAYLPVASPFNAPFAPAAGGMAEIVDPRDDAAARFYRLVVRP